MSLFTDQSPWGRYPEYRPYVTIEIPLLGSVSFRQSSRSHELEVREGLITFEGRNILISKYLEILRGRGYNLEYPVKVRLLLPPPSITEIFKNSGQLRHHPDTWMTGLFDYSNPLSNSSDSSLIKMEIGHIDHPDSDTMKRTHPGYQSPWWKITKEIIDMDDIP